MYPGLRHPEQHGALATSPVLLAAIVVLVVNDFALKRSSVPGWLTGKLSDVSGLIALPIVLMCAAELIAARTVPVRFSVAVAAAVGGLFGTAKWNAGTNHVVARIWGVLLMHPSRPAGIAMDRTDLLAVPAAFVAPLLQLRRSTRHRPVLHRTVRP
jgi:hypothetical protein